MFPEIRLFIELYVCTEGTENEIREPSSNTSWDSLRSLVTSIQTISSQGHLPSLQGLEYAVSTARC